MTTASTSIPSGDLKVYVCDVCGSKKEQRAGIEAAPKCGHVHTDTNRFPDGGWIRIEQYEPHGEMRDTGGTIAVNPLQALADYSENLRKDRIRRAELVANADRDNPAPVSDGKVAEVICGECSWDVNRHGHQHWCSFNTFDG
jgi:hypothetical protein